ncbi:MAG: hypothetical protein KJO30_01110 [Boseongicola sp.]|nr:hypothetical protein [Boseongicola sp.]
MDAPALFIHLVAKTFFLGLPLAVAWLALRRLMLSKTVNAWIYAGAGLFAVFTAVGLAPWALGFQPISWMFLIFAFLCPPLWLATVVLCGMGRVSGYDMAEFEAEEHTKTEDVDATPKARPAPLMLVEPIWPEPEQPPEQPIVTANPVFKTHRSILRNARDMASARLKSESEDRSVLDVARSMRGNPNTAKRRMRPLLPPPHAMSDLPNLPFLQR